MIHRTYRSLDQPPKLVGFTARQWAALIADTTLVLGLVYALRVPAKGAITLLTFTVGLPAALAYVSEAGGAHPGQLASDLLRWYAGGRALRARERPGSRPDATTLLRVRAIDADGLLVRDDNTLVRALEVSAVNPLAMEPAEAERVSVAFAQVAARLPDGASLQLLASAAPLALEHVLAERTYRCQQAAGAAADAGEDARAESLRALAAAGEESLRAGAQLASPLRLRFLVLAPWRPERAALALSRGRRHTHGDELDRATIESLRHLDGVRGDLEAAGLSVRPLDGLELLDELARRCDPAHDAGGGMPASFRCPDAVGARDPDGRTAAATTLARALCTARIQAHRDHMRLGGWLERSSHVSLAPEQTWLGWLLHLMQAPRPFTVSVHVHGSARHRERLAQKRRYRRIHGVNRGVEARGRPLDPDARVQEQEAAELNDELATSPGGGIYRVSIYAALGAPDGDDAALAETCAALGRELTLACDARVQHAPFAQQALWRSTLPLGADAARRRRRYLSANVGDSFPLVGTSFGSPAGIAVGYALPGRTLTRLDPFDHEHANHLLLVNGVSGAGKTMTAILLLARALAEGANGFIIDRAGHFEFLASLLPGAATVQIGGEGHAINCWDVANPAEVGAEKVDYLLALHALLLGEHHQGRDSYGLSDLEANLLGMAIAAVYARCAASGEEPRELLLQQELERRHHIERSAGSAGVAEALRNLSIRVNNYVLDGPYAYLADRPTTIPAGAPLTVLDTRTIPEAKAAAALFVICEHVKSRIEGTRARHLAGDGAPHAWAGRSFLAIDEAWKLIERPATGRWFNEFCRRSRHYALWLIAISQQLSDFDNEHGKALLANATMRLFLRQEARELAYVKQTLRLSDGAIGAISALKTVRGAYATAYLMNGTRGEGTVRIDVGAHEYWMATSDPVRDEPARQQALRATNGDGWAALRALAQEPAARTEPPAPAGAAEEAP